MPTSIRLYLDEDVDPQVAERLTATGLDVLTPREAGRRGSTDEEQLIFAVGENRAIYSHNVRDFEQIARSWAASGRHHAGIMYSAQKSPASVAKMIADVCVLYDKLDDVVIWLPVKP